MYLVFFLVDPPVYVHISIYMYTYIHICIYILARLEEDQRTPGEVDKARPGLPQSKIRTLGGLKLDNEE